MPKFKKGDCALVIDQDWGFYHGLHNAIVVIESWRDVSKDISPYDIIYTVICGDRVEELYEDEMQYMTKEEALLWKLKN